MIPLNQIKIGLSTRHRNEEVPNGKWEVLLREVEGRSNLFLFTYPHQREGVGEGALTPNLHHSTLTIKVESCSGLSINSASFRKEESPKSCLSLK